MIEKLRRSCRALGLGEIERGESNVTIQTLKIVADTLGVKVADLVKGVLVQTGCYWDDMNR
jgi:hypothetical protein